MSSPIVPAEGPPGLSIATDPPPEVLEQVLAAAAIAEQLRQCGYALRFFAAAADGARARIEVHDADGRTVSVLSAVQAVEMAVAVGDE